MIEFGQERGIGDYLIDLWVAFAQPAVELLLLYDGVIKCHRVLVRCKMQ